MANQEGNPQNGKQNEGKYTYQDYDTSEATMKIDHAAPNGDNCFSKLSINGYHMRMETQYQGIVKPEPDDEIQEDFDMTLGFGLLASRFHRKFRFYSAF